MISSCTSAQPPAEVKQLDPACAQGIAKRSTTLLELTEQGDVLESGGVLLLRDGWVLAGIQSNQPPARYSHESRQIVPRFVHSSTGTVIPVPTARPGAPVDIPVPVLLADGRWGAMWAKATPPAWQRGAWPADRYTEIWFSELNGHTWGTARIVMQANLGIDWRNGRTLQYIEGRGTLVMLVQEEHAMDRRVMFGSPENGLLQIAVDSALSPYAATFLADNYASITAVLQTGPISGNPGIPATFALMHSPTGGRTWSGPKAIGFPSAAAQNLRLHRDANGGMHLIWSDNGRLRHGWRATPASGWLEMPVPDSVSGVTLLRTVSGITGVGQLAVVREAVSENDDAQILIACFTNGAWSGYEPLAYSAHYLLTGTAYDDRWVLGWSGAGRPESRAWLTVWGVSP